MGRSMMTEIKDFIGVFPNAIPDEDCDKIIKFYEKLESLEDPNITNRQKFEGTSPINKDTGMTFISHHTGTFYEQTANTIFSSFNNNFWNCYDEYTKKYGILQNINSHQFYNNVKIQKTIPTGGYHQWHCEHDGRVQGSRLLLVIGYLNDVEEGGETEFLYQSRRIPAKKGTIMICPSGFTHTHRGNPPLSGDKYIINGWIEFTQ
jgi:hypothetical protein